MPHGNLRNLQNHSHFRIKGVDEKSLCEETVMTKKMFNHDELYRHLEATEAMIPGDPGIVQAGIRP